MEKKKELIISIAAIVVLVLAIVGVSFAAFNYSRTGEKVNTITSGVLSMSYTETDNIIQIDKALPTTDTTGVGRMNEGEYFDFNVMTNIQGNSYINYEISAKAIEGNTISGDYIKLYLSQINNDGTETNITPIQYGAGSDTPGVVISGVPTYTEETSANEQTGRPAGEMSLGKITVTTKGEQTTKYRLRMYVSEDYNPQGDGGNLTFGVRVNVYGKSQTIEAGENSGMLKAYQSGEAFHTSAYSGNITSVATKGDTTIPSSAVNNWDVSEDQDGSVIAYIEDDGRGAGTYTLTIGANGKIIANPNMKNYFANFSKAESIDLSYLDTSLVTDMGSMFSGCRSLTSLDLVPLDTSQVTDMYRMFYDCSSLTSLDLAPLDTSQVTGMNSMFTGCSSLTNLDLTPLDTSKVTDMGSMFSSCSGLTSLNLTSFDTSNVTNMYSMFSRCTSLTEIVFGGEFSTSNVTNMGAMFSHCSSLKSLDLSGFDTSNVTSMGNTLSSWLDMYSFEYLLAGDQDGMLNIMGMFGGCSSLTSLDLRNFDTSKVTNMFTMFYDTPNLTEVLVSDKWVTDQVTESRYMFY